MSIDDGDPQIKILKDDLRAAEKAFKEQQIIVSNHRVYVNWFSDDADYLNTCLDQVNDETDAFIEKQDAAIEYYKYLLWSGRKKEKNNE